MKKVIVSLIIIITCITTAEAQPKNFDPRTWFVGGFEGLTGYRQPQHRARINATVYIFEAPSGGQVTGYFKQMSNDGKSYQVFPIPLRVTPGQARTIQSMRPLVAADGVKYLAIKVLIISRFSSPDFVPEQNQDLDKYRDNWVTEYFINIAETDAPQGHSSYDGSL